MSVSAWIARILPLVLALVVLREWRRSGKTLAQTLGTTLDRSMPVDALVGIAIGAIVMLGIFGTEWMLGAIAMEGVASPGRDWYVWMLVLVLAAGLEELLSRSFMLQGLVILLGRRRWTAVALSSAVFGLAHLANPNASAVSVIGNALGGVVYAVAFLGTGTLWMAWGLHFSWNFFQGQVLGFPVSGMTLPDLIDQSTVGPDWLTGGAYGPEAGAIGIAARFVVIGLVFALLGARQPRGSWRDVFLFRSVPEQGSVASLEPTGGEGVGELLPRTPQKNE